jgi:crotonobetainyl-CoA:carnitine CoA-transferase CaiB-like acyl-CoA transferase
MSSIRPLAGLVVVEIGHSIAASYAGMVLGELGAEVIKGVRGRRPVRIFGLPPFEVRWRGRFFLDFDARR